MANEKLTLLEKANILLENGVDVYGCIDSDMSLFAFPYIQFGGDDAEGPRAVRILQEHGISVSTLHKDWWYGKDGDCCEQRWSLVLYHADQEEVRNSIRQTISHWERFLDSRSPICPEDSRKAGR